jgi:hypothetical protein
MLTLGLGLALIFSNGCALLHRPADGDRQVRTPPLVVVVAPVLNLSNSTEWDPLKVTDIVASELQSFPDVFVIPVNRTLAALALTGKDVVETPQDALELAREFNADATIVTAITEYNPYDPPIVGVVMQWYGTSHGVEPRGFDPVSASRQAAEVLPAGSAQAAEAAPLVQVQRVFDAADEAVLDEVRQYASRRTGHGSPYGWRVHLKSQELFVRFSCWSCIRPMLLERKPDRTEPGADEAKRWTREDDV